ncbi:MAG TPA: hypothetical protein PKY59_16590 [Pyrinomonadaceae bacterium]|nr:hypothetical protein [Pyrinomonadaceae bacterium]
MSEEEKVEDVTNENNGNNNGNADENAAKISPVGFGVILLGVYLIAVLLLSVYLLGITIMAEPPEKTFGTLRENCCGKDNAGCPPIAEAVNPPANTSSTNAATNSVNVNSVAPNTNTANANAANSNGVNAANTNRTATNSTANRTAATTNSATNTANNTAATPTPFQQALPEIQIPPYVCVQHFNRLTADGFLFLVVLFAGMLGASVRGVFSFVRHLGVGDFSFNWLWFYLLLPFSGAPVSLFLYFLIRGGFYGSPINKGLVLNLAAFAALGCLAGLFSENAMEKLRQVAEVLMTKVPRKSSKTSNPPGS